MTKESLIKFIQSTIRETIADQNKEIDEMSTTGNIEAPPHKGAFSKKDRGTGKRKKGYHGGTRHVGEGGHHSPAVDGYTIVESSIKKGDKLKIKDDSGDIEDVIVASDFTGGVSQAQFVVLKRKKGAPITITPSRLKKWVDNAKKESIESQLETLNEARNGAYHRLKTDDTLNTRQKIGLGMREIYRMLGEIDRIVELHGRLKSETETDTTGLWKRTQNAFIKIENRMMKIQNKFRRMK